MKRRSKVGARGADIDISAQEAALGRILAGALKLEDGLFNLKEEAKLQRARARSKMIEKYQAAEKIQLSIGDPVVVKISGRRGSGTKYGYVINMLRKAGLDYYECRVYDEDREKVEVWNICDASDNIRKATGELLKKVEHYKTAIEAGAVREEIRQKERIEKDRQAFDQFVPTIQALFRSRYDQPSNLTAKIKFTEGVFSKTVTGANARGVFIAGRKKTIPWMFVIGLEFPDKSIPIKLNSVQKDSVEKGECVLVGISNGEFFEDSIAVAKEMRTVCLKSYDSPNSQYFYDPAINAYWRHAGFFD